MTDLQIDSSAGYGRCGDCNELKHVTPDGVVHVHNRYRTSGTTLVALRCPGSGSRPVDAKQDELNP